LTTEANARAQNCWPAPEVQANVNHAELGSLKLSTQEIDDLVAFLKTLTDGYKSESPWRNKTPPAQ
jgi:cytochrome c peroxidase